MALKINVSGSGPLKLAADLVAVCVEEGLPRRGHLKSVYGALGSAAVTRAIKRAEFTGKKGQTCQLPAGRGRVRAQRVLLIGIGKAADLTFSCVRRFAAKAARSAAGADCASLGFALPEKEVPNALRAAAEGVVLGGYRYERYKTGDRLSKFPLEKVTLLVPGKVGSAHRDVATLGQRVAEAVCIARDLINEPPNELYPETLANAAVEVAKTHKTAGVTCTVLDDKQLLQKGMGLLHAVGRGSVRGPRFVHMQYRPPKADKKKRLPRLVFVGKGLTFDTGGICIKPAPGMEEMKGDMGGAANVIALMAAVGITRPEAEIHGLVASAENMPDGNAYRPGDIFKSYEGKTVEIINTDAEGRLALADALAYGAQLDPDIMLDNATLTGAIVVALGPTVSGYYASSDELAERYGRAARRAGEAMWHMPLVEDLREKLKSDWADLKHVGDRWGGSITAALFLREFVGKAPWIHVDIAGPSMADKAFNIYTKGGTGHGVLTYLELIDDVVANGVAPAPTQRSKPRAAKKTSKAAKKKK
jgi:leucyl aminopeptidase